MTKPFPKLSRQQLSDGNMCFLQQSHIRNLGRKGKPNIRPVTKSQCSSNYPRYIKADGKKHSERVMEHA